MFVNVLSCIINCYLTLHHYSLFCTSYLKKKKLFGPGLESYAFFNFLLFPTFNSAFYSINNSQFTIIAMTLKIRVFCSVFQNWLALYIVQFVSLYFISDPKYRRIGKKASLKSVKIFNLEKNKSIAHQLKSTV